MKQLIILISLVVLTGSAMAQQPQAEPTKSDQVEVGVDGLACPFCAYGLEKKLKKLEGIKDIKIDVEEGLVTLDIENGHTITEEAIRKKVKDAGFTPKEITF